MTESQNAPAPTVGPLALRLILVGAAVLAVSTFLPLYGTAIDGQPNTMIQRGGWLLLIYAAIIAVAGWFAVARKPRLWRMRHTQDDQVRQQ